MADDRPLRSASQLPFPLLPWTLPSRYAPSDLLGATAPAELGLGPRARTLLPVAAEWVRLQDAKSPTDYHKVIDSNDVKAWPLRAPNEKWNKDELFQRYRQIFLNGEFTYDVDTAEGVMVYIVGGVDFSKAPKHNIAKATTNQFVRER